MDHAPCGRVRPHTVLLRRGAPQEPCGCVPAPCGTPAVPWEGVRSRDRRFRMSARATSLYFFSSIRCGTLFSVESDTHAELRLGKNANFSILSKNSRMKSVSGSLRFAVDEGEYVLEHSGCRTAGRNHLDHLASLLEECFPAAEGSRRSHFRIDFGDAVPEKARSGPEPQG